MIGCCVANIGFSSKFRCNECHQQCHQLCATNLCHKMFQNEFSSPILSHAHILIPKSVLFEFFVLSRIFRLRFTIWKEIFVIFLFFTQEYKVIGDESSTAISREFFNNDFQVYLLLALSWLTITSWSIVNWPFPISYLLLGGNLKIKMSDWRGKNVPEKKPKIVEEGLGVKFSIKLA